MINLEVTKMDPGKAAQLREWMAEMTERADEVRETLANEGVRHELAQLVATSDGPLLIYMVECDDFDAALTAYEHSPFSIDAQHKKVMTEIQGEPLVSEVLLDIQR
jgi:hypothetical protein